MGYKARVLEITKELNLTKVGKEGVFVHSLRGPKRIVELPLKIDERLSFLVGAIIGDGHLRKDKNQISIELTNYELINKIRVICNELFNQKFNINKRKNREGHKESHTIYLDSKGIYLLFNKVFEISSGKKSSIVKVPDLIFSSNKRLKSAFLVGILATEGGRRKRGFGLSSASKDLCDDLSDLFKELDIKIIRDKWTNKNYNKDYYGLAFNKHSLVDITKNCKEAILEEIIKKMQT